MKGKIIKELLKQMAAFQVQNDGPIEPEIEFIDMHPDDAEEIRTAFGDQAQGGEITIDKQATVIRADAAVGRGGFRFHLKAGTGRESGVPKQGWGGTQ